MLLFNIVDLRMSQISLIDCLTLGSVCFLIFSTVALIIACIGDGLLLLVINLYSLRTLLILILFLLIKLIQSAKSLMVVIIELKKPP